MEPRSAVRDDGGVAGGHRAGVAAGVELPAAGRVVTPGDSRRNRSVAEENGAWGRTRHSSLAGHRVGRRILPEFRLGAGPRRPGGAWWMGSSWVKARARPRVARARLSGVAAPARGQSGGVGGGSDSAGPGPGGVACPGWWLCSVDWHASAASVGRRVDRPGSSTAPGAVGAGTGIHSP